VLLLFTFKALADQALQAIYKQSIPGADFPFFAGQSLSSAADAALGTKLTVTVKIEAGGKPCPLTTAAPLAATQSTTLGKPGSVPRNECITYRCPTPSTKPCSFFPQDCGYPAIIGTSGPASKPVVLSLNASAVIGSDGSSIVLTNTDPAPAGFKATSTSYGRASWPRTVFFAKAGANLPVIPWYANFTTTSAWTPPGVYGSLDPLILTGSP